MANTVRQTGSVGARYDLRVRKGANLEKHRLTLTQVANGDAFNLTGYLVRAWCKGRGDSSAVTVTFDITRVDDAAGQIDLDMSKTKTALLPAPLYSTSPAVAMDWWLEIESVSGAVTPIFYGEYEVSA